MVGSHGDVHPFVGLGARLRERGHRVTAIVNPFFEPLARRAGLDVVPLGTADDYRQLAARPELWHPIEGPRLVMRETAAGSRAMYDAVVANVTPGQTVAVGSSLAVGARAAAEKHGFPLVTVHLSPALFRSVYDNPIFAGMFMPRWLPRRMKTWIFDLGDKLVIQPSIGPGLNALCADLGLPPVQKFMHKWWHSPDLVIGMFPEWYAPRQPDWPPQLRQTSFPLWDERGLSQTPAGLEEFLASGDPPVVFTPGSAMWNGHRFFEQSTAACRRLGIRGILLSRHAGHIPKHLPPHVRHFDYVPFSELLPRAAALVHHGGIGTTAQALAAGVPQLVAAMTHDQPDNAARVQRLGVGTGMKMQRYNARSVADRLRNLLSSPTIKDNCRKVASLFQAADGLAQSCDLIESLANSRGIAPHPNAPTASPMRGVVTSGDHVP